MRLLFDQNSAISCLPSCQTSSPAQLRFGCSTSGRRTIARSGRSGGFAIVSLDADFAELAQLRGPPPKVIWLRCGNQPTHFVADLLRRQAAAVQDFGIDTETACLELY